MLIYKCDGESYTTGGKCESESENELPERWLVISGKIKNGLYDAHYIECNGTRHFCSRRCLENFLFKDVIPPAESPALNTMNINLDPKEGQEEVKEETAEQATETESAEEGTKEG